MSTHKVIIYSISERGVLPQFFAQFPNSAEADEYDAMLRKLAARAGVMIRIDRDPKHEDANK